MIPEDPAPNIADGERAGAAADLAPKMPNRRGGHKYISPRTGPKNLKSDDNAHDKETTDQNPERLSTLPRAGDSRDSNDEQANADNLPATIDADNAKLPASYEQAKKALAACESIDEYKDWEDRAAALAAYGRMAGDSELEKHALRLAAFVEQEARDKPK